MPSFKATVILALLVCQNAAAVLLVRASRVRKDAPVAHVGIVVILQEVVKCVVSIVWCLLDSWADVSKRDVPYVKQPGQCDVDVLDSNGTDVVNQSVRESTSTSIAWTTLASCPCVPFSCNAVLGPNRSAGDVLNCALQQLCVLRSLGQMAIPAALFAIQNMMLFVAMSNLDPTVFLVVYQSKVFFTASLMMMMLNRSFTARKWVALVFLVLGIVVAQIESIGIPSSPPAFTAPTDSAQSHEDNTALGLTSVLVCAITSSLASVAMEKFIKGSEDNLFISTRNVHLSTLSMLFIGTPMILRILLGVDETFHGVFHGVDGLVWFVVLNQAVGGILVALCLRHADNIMKSFATALAIVASGVVSNIMFAFEPPPAFFAGAVVVIAAAALYAAPESAP